MVRTEKIRKNKDLGGLCADDERWLRKSSKGNAHRLRQVRRQKGATKKAEIECKLACFQKARTFKKPAGTGEREFAGSLPKKERRRSCTNVGVQRR